MRFTLSFMLIFAYHLLFAMDINVVNNFNVTQYIGKWYEIARLPNRFERQCIAPITATYSLNPNNVNQIIVVNKCDTEGGKPDVVTGIANFTKSSTIGKLEVTFLPKWLRWLPFGYGDYWVLSTDYNNISVVGSPNHDYLWILARTENISQNQLNQAIEVAKAQGFETTTLIINSVPYN